MPKHNTVTMDELLAAAPVSELKAGEVVEGTISSVRKHELWVDLGPAGLGVVMRREIGQGQPLEVGQVLIDHDGRMQQWEDVSSGRAIVERFGKPANEINDPAIWQLIAYEMSLGLIDLIAVTQPQVIIMGGGVNTNFDKYSSYLEKDLKKYETPLVPIPPIRKAQHPEEAVIYGCFEFLKDYDAELAH